MTASGRAGGIIVAAGRSERMGGVDKLLLSVAGRPLVAHSIAAFAAATAIDELVVVASEANRDAIGSLTTSFAPRARIVLGGRRRRDSVHAGLVELTDCDYVVIHDGARPLVTPALIEAALAGARETGAALCAVPVTDTVKRADGDGLVHSTVSRENLWLAQTPQAFNRELLLRAHAAVDVDATDDAALIEWLEEPVRLVMGSTRNLKVTTAEDVATVEALLRAQAGRGP